MSDFLADVRARAAALGRTIVFPESEDPRTQEAVRALARERIVRPVLLLAPGVRVPADLARVDGLTVREVDDALHERTIADLLEARAKKGLTRDAAEHFVRNPLFVADAMVRRGEVDGCVAGAVNTTGDVIRAALWLVGAAPGVRTVSSAFYMVTGRPFRGGERETLTFTDCAVVPYPSAEQLADIAVAAAADRVRIVGDEPRVALLSFSTRGSGAGPSIDTVRQALQLLESRGVRFAVDGELQGDAALIASVAERKAAGSPVAGRANVLVFPSLDAGNIAYKLVERVGGAAAVGPIVQGLAKPCSDLSRGASADDIINVAAITALQGSPPSAGDAAIV